MLGGTLDKYFTKLRGSTTNLFHVSQNNYLLYIITHDQTKNLFSVLQKLEKSLFVYDYIYIYIYKVIPLQARRVGRGIALLFHDRGTRRGEWSAARSGRTLPRERSGTHFTGGWVGPRAGLDRRKISSPLGFDPGPFSRAG